MPDSTDQFVTLLTDHQSAILAYIRSLTPGSSGARDLKQEVNITLWNKRDHFELGTNFKAWSFQIVRYHILNHRRKLQRQGWLIFDDDLLDTFSADGEKGPEEVDARHLALRDCMSRLRDKDRELLRHRYTTSKPLEDYARTTALSVGTLKATLFRIRAALRKCIDGKITKEGDFA
ncbi:sigma-70 family RNA polymerase sigma factor [Akkermansiaceae bacterium]|nr:sigma-70 family RNA polymerase sigma factor [Akkermansiaceae bacterium]